MTNFTQKFSKYIDIGWKLAQSIDRPNKHCSFIIRGNRLLSVGLNERKTHPLAKKYGYIESECHSELMAWIGCRHRDIMSKDLILLNLHYNNLGQLKLAKCCEKCLPWCSVIFGKIYYSNYDGNIIKL